MSTKSENYSYEKLILIKAIPYWLYWPALCLLFFLLSEVLLRDYTGNKYWEARALLCVYGGIMPVMITRSYHSFRTIFSQLTELSTEKDKLSDWVETKALRVFTLKFWPARLTILLFVVSAIVTVLFLGLPFRSSALNIFSLIGFGLFSVLPGHGMYVLLALMHSSHELNQLPMKAFFLPEPIVSKMHNYFTFVTTWTVFTYALLVIAIWVGPYPLTGAMLFWLTFATFFPLSVFLWTLFQTHIFIQNSKYKLISAVNYRIEQRLGYMTSHTNLDNLEKLLNVQKRINDLADWPVSIQSVFSFAVSIALPIIQIIRAIASP